jgi:putative aldouronate transport system permease protein
MNETEVLRAEASRKVYWAGARRAGGILADAAITAALVSFAFICLYPLYYILIYSISLPKEAAKGLSLLPRGFTLENYRQLFLQGNLLSALMVSLARTTIGPVLTVFCTALFAYLLTQPKLRFKKAIYRMVVVTMYLNAGLIPWYLTMTRLGLRNNFLIYVLPSAVGAFGLILVKTYMEQTPPSLQESATIDGAGPFLVFYKIMLPICRPVLATVAIFAAVDQWNTWMDNFYLVTDRNLQTLQLLLLTFLTDRASQTTSTASRMNMSKVTVTPTSIRMTMTMIVTLPVLFVYPVFQRHFMKGILIGAVKG